MLPILPYNPERDGTKMFQRSLKWKHHLLPSTGGIVQHPFCSRQDGYEDKYSHRQDSGEDLKEYVMRFNQEAILTPDLQDRVAYAAFLNGLLPGRFKFSLVESKVTNLADVLRRA